MQPNVKKKYRLLLLAIVSGYFLVALSAYFQAKSAHTVCVFKNLTGYPCPGCGTTRATILLFKGKLIESLLLNPVGLIVNMMALTAVFMIIRDFRLRKTDFDKLITKKLHPAVLVMIVILVIANEIWNISKGL